MSDQNVNLDVSAKSIEEAIEQGLNQLGLSRDQVNIEILNEGRRGIFGLGSEDAVVRLTPIEVKSDVVQSAPPSTSTNIVTDIQESSETPKSHDSQRAGDHDLPAKHIPSADVAIADAEPAEPAAQKQKAAESAQARQSDQKKIDRAGVEEIAIEYLQTLLDHMGIKAEVTTRLASDLVDPGEEPPLVLDIKGNDLGILIGRRSETLQALQYMVRLMASKKMGSWQRVVVDVESYRSRRRRSLSQLAQRMADKAVATQERVVMESMSAYERRIIHVTLRDHPSVITKSIGRDNNRKVTIIPK